MYKGGNDIGKTLRKLGRGENDVEMQLRRRRAIRKARLQYQLRMSHMGKQSYGKH